MVRSKIVTFGPIDFGAAEQSAEFDAQRLGGSITGTAQIRITDFASGPLAGTVNILGNMEKGQPEYVVVGTWDLATVQNNNILQGIQIFPHMFVEVVSATHGGPPNPTVFVYLVT